MSAPDTLTLASLRTTEFAPGQLGVLGDPIAHSLSPAMHNAAIATLLPTNPRLAGVRYHRLHITAEELPTALALLHAKGFAGVNLTVPHKIQALSIAETLSPEARRAESADDVMDLIDDEERKVPQFCITRLLVKPEKIADSVCICPEVTLGELPSERKPGAFCEIFHEFCCAF